MGHPILDPKFGSKGNGLYDSREVCPPALFVRDNVGQVLQRRVSSNGKDAGDRLCVPTRRMQRQDALAMALSPVEIPSRLHRKEKHEKVQAVWRTFPEIVMSAFEMTGC